MFLDLHTENPPKEPTSFDQRFEKKREKKIKTSRYVCAYQNHVEHLFYIFQMFDKWVRQRMPECTTGPVSDGYQRMGFKEQRW